MTFLTPENFIFLFFVTTSMTNLFAGIFIAYLFREILHLKVTLSYTLQTIKKLYPEFGTDADIEAILSKSTKKE